MSAGFQRANFEIVLAAEKWCRARAVYDANFEHRATDLDLSDIIDSSFIIGRQRPDIIIGGPPCQDFSSAGQRQERSRADLTGAFAELVRATRPQWFVMENVPAMAQSRAYQVARPRLSGAGYGLTEMVLDASTYGVPQIRKRFFVVGCLGESDGFLENELASERSEQQLTVRDYLGDELGIPVYYRHPRVWGRRAIYSVDEPAATVRSVNRPISPKYRLQPNDAWHTLEGVRRLTSEERARIQTFDRRFRLSGYLSDIDLMVANAVPVELAKRVAQSIVRYEGYRGLDANEKAFRRWLAEQRGYSLRAAGNVISRLHRVNKLIGAKGELSDPRDTLHVLSKNDEFRTLSSSVRSQLRRAVNLRAAFREKADRTERP